jgi:coatomer protein complex subunit alpha (xenin)
VTIFPFFFLLLLRSLVIRYLGKVEDRVKILAQVGQTPLAYVTAATHGLTEEAERIARQLGKAPEDLPQVAPNAKLLMPPEPIVKDQSNWPLLTISRGFFDGGVGAGGAKKLAAAAVEDVDTETGDAWGGDDLDDLDGEGASSKRAAKGGADDAAEDAAGGEDAWGAGEDLDLEGLDLGDDKGGAADAAAASDDSYYVPPTKGKAPTLPWTNSGLPVDQAMAGAFGDAMAYLNQTLGIVNFAPLEGMFINSYVRSRAAVMGCTSAPGMLFALHRNWKNPGKNALPAIGVQLPGLVKQLQAAYQATTAGKFADALSRMQQILIQVQKKGKKKKKKRAHLARN